MSLTPTSVLPCSGKEVNDDDIYGLGAAHHCCRRHQDQLPRGRLRRTGHHAARVWARRVRTGQLATQHPRVGTAVPRTAPDIVGFGATERPDDIIYSLRTWTDHVWAFLDAHDIGKTAIVGNSLGWPHRASDGHRPARPDHQDGADGRTGCRHDAHRRPYRAARLRTVS